MAEKSPSLLVVDDTPDNVELLLEIFRGENYQVMSADSVTVAKRVLTTNPGKVDLIISDISMPVETGFDLLNWLKSEGGNLSGIPVLFITSQMVSDEDRIKGLSLGAVDYIVRPIDTKELILRVGIAVEHVRQLETLRHSLEDSERLAMVGRLLAASNHEIKNVAGLIQITAQQVCSSFTKLTSDPVNLRYSDALLDSSKLLSDITKNFSLLIGGRQMPDTVFELKSVVREIQNIMEPKVRPISIEIQGIADETWVKAPITVMKQILINFILNAFDSMTNQSGFLPGKIIISARVEGKHCSIEVQDAGVGLSKKEVRKDFRPFATTKSIKGGRGLGLWLCARLADSFNAHIELRSEGPGKGATSILVVPISSKSEAPMDISAYLDT